MKSHPLPVKSLQRLVSSLGLFSLFGLIALSPTSVLAQHIWDTANAPFPVDNDWSNGTNWQNGIPTTTSTSISIRQTAGGLHPIIDGENVSVSSTGNSFIGGSSWANSRLDIRSGSLTFSAGELFIAPGSSGPVFNVANTALTGQSNLTTYGRGTGSFSATQVVVGRDSGTVGTININTSGSFSIGSKMELGRSGSGTINLSSGNFTSSTDFFMGANASGSGSFTVENDATATINKLEVGRNGTGTFTVAGASTVTFDTATSGNGLIISSGTGTGTVNLNGGTLSVHRVEAVTGGSSTFNFNGGTLEARSDAGNFLQGLTAANILSGGAGIDSNGFNITIAQSLQGAGDLTKLGAGTLTLSGSNSFTGNISVEAGTLSITAAFINSLATVSLESGALLDLNFIGDNVIGALIVDGVNLGTGTFTSSESFLSGAGSLTVIPEPSTFAFLGGLLALGMVVIRRRNRR
jgi:fibronectin-binding autotransporter adhesin